MSERKDIIKSIVVLTAISLVVSGLLAVVNGFTAPVSAANAAVREETARAELIADADRFTAVEADLPDNVLSAYAAYRSDEIIGYVITAESGGFGGDIQVMAAIGADGKIISVKTLDVSTETPTLGGKTANSDYTGQYAGQDISLSGVDAISGATITSNAYRNCVLSAFEAYSRITGEVLE